MATLVQSYNQNSSKIIRLDILDIYGRDDFWPVAMLENKLHEFPEKSVCFSDIETSGILR